MLAWSDRMSPNMLPVTITSNWPGLTHQLHRRVVGIHVGQRDIGIVDADFGHHVAPQLRRFEHIGLVDRVQRLLAPHRHLETDVAIRRTSASS